MPTQTLTLILVALFFAAMLFIGYRTHLARNRTVERENFLIGNRNVSAWLVAIGTLMGWVDAFQFSFTSALGFEWGLKAYVFAFTSSIVFFLMAWAAPTIRTRASQNDSLMMGNYFSSLYSPRCAAVVGVAMFVYFFIWLLMQFVFGGQVLAAVTGIKPAVAIGAMATVTLAYMLLGGFLASIRNDFLQFCIFLAFVAVVLYVVLPQTPQWITAAPRNPPSWTTVVSMAVISLASTLAAPDVWQRLYSASSVAEARRSMMLTALLMIPMLAFFTLLGQVVASHNAAADSNSVVNAIFLNIMPHGLLPFAVLAFIAAVMSTIATSLFGSAMTLTSDIARELGWLKTDAALQRWCRLLMVGLTLAAMVISQLPFDIISIGTTCMATCLVVTPITLAALFRWPFTERAMFYSLAFSLTAFFVGAYFNIYAGDLGTLPLFIATGTLLLLEGLLRPATQPSKRPRKARAK